MLLIHVVLRVRRPRLYALRHQVIHEYRMVCGLSHFELVAVLAVSFGGLGRSRGALVGMICFGQFGRPFTIALHVCYSLSSDPVGYEGYAGDEEDDADY